MSGLGNKEIMANNIKYYMDIAKKDRSDVCADLGIKYTTFSDWVTGKKYPRIDKIEALANYFGVEKSDLIENHKQGVDYEKLCYVKTIPVLGSIAGGPAMIADECYAEFVNVTDKNLDYALRVVGNSMKNAGITEGGMVFINKDAEIINGMIVVALINQYEATIKRFYQYGELVVLRPENEDVEEKEYDVRDIKILGRVEKVTYLVK